VQAIGDPADPVAGEYVGDGPVRFFPDGSEPIRLTLSGGEISFTAGCNHFSGHASWDDGVLRTGVLGGTEMGCPGIRQEQDDWMVHFFGSEPTIHRDGSDVRLRSDQGEVWFVPADEARPSSWSANCSPDRQVPQATPARPQDDAAALLPGADLPVEMVVHR
jgi:hypothetical protein